MPMKKALLVEQRLLATTPMPVRALHWHLSYRQLFTILHRRVHIVAYLFGMGTKPALTAFPSNPSMQCVQIYPSYTWLKYFKGMAAESDCQTSGACNIDWCWHRLPCRRFRCAHRAKSGLIFSSLLTKLKYTKQFYTYEFCNFQLRSGGG